jgi:hypothetical protein
MPTPGEGKGEDERPSAGEMVIQLTFWQKISLARA